MDDAFDERVGASGAETRVRGERPEHGDAADARAASHKNVFRRVADINGGFRHGAKAAQGKFERRRMRLAALGGFGVDARAEESREAKAAKLAADTGAVAAGNEPDNETR